MAKDQNIEAIMELFLRQQNESLKLAFENQKLREHLKAVLPNTFYHACPGCGGNNRRGHQKKCYVKAAQDFLEGLK